MTSTFSRIPITNNYKRYLKHLILENISDVEFMKNEPGKICSSKKKYDIVDFALEKSISDNLRIFEAAKLVCNNVIAAKSWKFTGYLMIMNRPRR